jgi:rhodanese-related sulfurtransferase
VPAVDVARAKEILEQPPAGLVVLDVRTPDEFSEGHLPGSVLVDFHEPDFPARLQALDPEVPYLIYCRSGARSGRTEQLMGQLGFSDVTDVEGGILAWIDAGLPVERQRPSR